MSSLAPPAASVRSVATGSGRAWRWGWGLVLVGVVVVAVGLALTLLLDPWLRRTLERQVHQQSHSAYELRLGSLRTRLWRRGLEVSQLQLRDNPQWRGRWPAALPHLSLAVGSVRLSGLGVLALLRGGVVPLDSLVLADVGLSLPAGLPPAMLADKQPLYARLPRRLAGLRLGLLALRRVRARYADGPATRAAITRADLLAHDVLLSAAGAADTSRTAYAVRLAGQVRGAAVRARGYVGQLAHAQLAGGRLGLDSLRVLTAGAVPTHIWLPRLRLAGWHTAAALHQRRFRADSLTLDKLLVQGPPPGAPARPLPALLAPYLRRADLASLRLRHAEIQTTSGALMPVIRDINLEGKALRLDAAATRDPRRVAYARAWLASTGRITAVFDAPFFHLAAAGLRLDTRRQTASLLGLAIQPTFSAAEQDRRKGEQSVHLAVRLPALRLLGLDFGRLARQHELVARTLVAERPTIEIASDGRAPLPSQPSIFTPLAVRKVPLLTTVQEVRVLGANVSLPYRSPRSPIVGHITLDGLSGTLHNLSNDPRRMTAAHPLTGEATARLQGQCPLALQLRIPLLDPLERHQVTGTFGAAPFAILNPMIGPTRLFEFSSGQLRTMRFDLRADLQQADGTMWAEYSDLKLKVLKSKGEVLKTNLLTKIETGAANALFIRNNNPRANGRLAPGRLRSRRDLHAAVFVLWRQALVSGLLNSAGVPQPLAQKLSEGKN
ncbi:DUF748 domain-containing protein [Hymenobacter sp. BRD128]|uniref:DUF748 domain-containing protein n=1 Tax=Hymenobacter sp. BRD128 TaxID=2675878 RepID=UPI00156746BC|nr:DUF748 domain-containing protein [Hymenobacter sp. BRD128]QKG58600.1 DUF748 domain-containing protein [Hymenobacter sp. BRD128]